MADSPTYVGDFYIGYRSWSVKDDGTLQSQNEHYDWPVGDIEAVCHPPSGIGSNRIRSDKHMVPNPDCECGLYAYYKIRPDRVRYGELMGVILVWGDLQLHQERMRAQFARIAGILVPTEFERPEKGDESEHATLMAQEWEKIDKVQEKYKIPLIRKRRPDEAEQFIGQEYGKHVLPSELPDAEGRASHHRQLSGDNDEEAA